MTPVRHLADRLISLSAVLSGLSLLFQVVVILVDVAGRELGHPLFGSLDLVTMSFAILVFGAMALCDREGGHIAIDVFENLFPRWFNRLTDVAVALLGAAIFLLIAWTTYESARLSLMLNLSTNLLYMPKAWFQWAVCIFSILTAAGMALRAFAPVTVARGIQGEGSAT